MEIKGIRANLIKHLKIKKNYFLFLMLFWILVITINDPFDVNNENIQEQTYGVNIDNVIGEVYRGVVLEQEFLAQKDNLKNVQLYMATYMRTNTSLFKVKIADKKNNVIYEEIINAHNIKDNSYYSFDFKKQANSKGNIYTITITGIDGTKGNSITIWSASKLQETDTKVKVNGEVSRVSLTYKVTYTNSNFLLCLKIAMWMLIIVLSFVCTLIIDGADEKNFLKLSLLLGILVVFFNPYPHPIDEVTHFIRSYGISRLNFNAEIVNGAIGSYLPENMHDIFINKLNFKTYFSDFTLWNQKFSENKVFYRHPYMSSVIPINHCVAAIGIFTGNLLGFNIIGSLILGRLCIFIFYIVFCYLAIRNMKYYKNLVLSLPRCPCRYG